MSFASMKERGSSIDKLLSAAEKMESAPKSYGDDRYWKPTRDKAGNALHIIRFLPEPEGERLPWVRYWDHGFQNPKTNLWYIEKSLTTLEQNDPVSEYNSMLWNSGGKDSPQRRQASAQKRRLKYVSNIYVIKDGVNPENNGKVFLYQYGAKIHEKLQEAMKPKFEDETPINPFDMYKGADFKMKISTIDGGDGRKMPNYDRSEFSDPAPLADDETMEAIYNQMHSLEAIIAPSEFKSYEELKARLDAVLGLGQNFTAQQEHDLSLTADTAPMKSVEPVSEPELDNSVDDNDDDTMSYFSKLANED